MAEQGVSIEQIDRLLNFDSLALRLRTWTEMLSFKAELSEVPIVPEPDGLKPEVIEELGGLFNKAFPNLLAESAYSIPAITLFGGTYEVAVFRIWSEDPCTGDPSLPESYEIVLANQAKPREHYLVLGVSTKDPGLDIRYEGTLGQRHEPWGMGVTRQSLARVDRFSTEARPEFIFEVFDDVLRLIEGAMAAGQLEQV